MSDYIIRGMAADKQVRFFAANTKDLVEKARRIHNTSPIATAALGRLMTGTAMCKNDSDIVTVQIKGDGPMGGLVVTSDAKARVKGYVYNKDVMLPPNAQGKLDVGGAIGNGVLTVIKDLGLKEPYSGQTNLITGEIAEDLTYYFASSEQIPTSVALGVLMNKENTVRQAGGFMIQMMPFASDEVITALEERLTDFTSVTSHLDRGETPEDMMAELQHIKQEIAVDQTILVVDSMTGQDAVNVAATFNEKIGIDGVILTKLDGDTRGGAALSIKAVTGKPILYVGMGEKLSDLEQFYPDRMASRILGMGDVLTLIEKAEAQIDEEQAKKMGEKLKKAEFDFNDFLDYMGQIKNMGGIGSILNMLPGMGLGGQMKNMTVPDDAEDNLRRTEAIIYSMTAKERANPDILNPSRKNRIAKGAGVDISEVNRLVKQFDQMKKMMKQMPGMMKGAKKGRFRLPF